MKDKENTNEIQDALEQLIQLKKNGKELIIIFGLGSYGDVLQTFPILVGLRKKFNNSSICYIHPSKMMPILLNNSNLVNKTIILGSKYHIPMKDLLIKKKLFELIVTLKYAVAYKVIAGSEFEKKNRDFLNTAHQRLKPFEKYMINFPEDNDYLWRHAHDNGMDMKKLMMFTGGFDENQIDEGRIFINKEHSDIAESLPSKYIVISNAAEALTIKRSEWTKTLPRKAFQELIYEFKAQNIITVHLGAAEDPSYEGVDYDLRGKTNILQSAAIIKKSITFLAPEGGLANLGRAVGKRGVVFFGSTPPEFFAHPENINILPKICGGCWWTTSSYLYICPKLDVVPACTNSIDVSEIYNAIQEMILRQELK